VQLSTFSNLHWKQQTPCLPSQNSSTYEGLLPSILTTSPRPSANMNPSTGFSSIRDVSSTSVDITPDLPLPRINPMLTPIPTLGTVLSTIRIITSAVPTTLVPQPSSETITSRAKLLPGAPCKADDECSPNDCYTIRDRTTTCCGPNISGCPGYDCAVSGDNGCLDPYKCATTGTKTCARW
jgi:hypothetical protein